MLKVSLSFPIILFSLYIYFSQGQYTLPACALSCAQTAGNEVGCDSNNTICVCTNNNFLEVVTLCVDEDCSESDAQTAVYYWDIVCGYLPANSTTVIPSSYAAPATSTHINISSSYPYETSSAANSPGTSSSHGPTPYPHGGSSASGSGSRSGSSTHAVALIAAWISAVVAVVV